MQSIALTMIVRDEAENIGRCLDSAGSIISRLLVVDTGSTDSTKEIVRGWADEHGVPLDLLDSEWRGFRENRTELLAAARGAADYLLMLDADMVLHHPDPLPELTLDCYHGRINGSLDYALPMLVRGDLPWFYEGVAHSYLCRAGEDGSSVEYGEDVLDGLAVDDHSHTTPEKIRRDLELLSAEHARDPLDARTVFYLAQTYCDLDRFQEAIHYYRMRANMGGFDEEAYYARYRLGCLLCEHVSYDEGAEELLRAWRGRPSRAEALRALAGATSSVADKIPYPSDKLFVGRGAYSEFRQRIEVSLVPAAAEPVRGTVEQHHLRASPSRPVRAISRPLRAGDVTAIVVTRGNVDLTPTLEPLLSAFDDVIVWNNAERDQDLGPFGRYAAIPEAKHDVIAWVDDDVIFRDWDALMRAFKPGMVVTNMDRAWIDGAGYGEFVSMQGAGSLCPADLPARVFAEYLLHHPDDEDFLIESDFIFGCLAPFKRVDLGYEVREFTDDADRLYTQPWQTEKKWAAIERCRAIVEGRRELTVA